MLAWTVLGRTSGLLVRVDVPDVRNAVQNVAVRELLRPALRMRNQVPVGGRERLVTPDRLHPVEDVDLFRPVANRSRWSFSGFGISLGHNVSHPIPTVSIALNEMSKVSIFNCLLGIVDLLFLLLQQLLILFSADFEVTHQSFFKHIWIKFE